jgi:signal transduction histidine kinase
MKYAHAARPQVAFGMAGKGVAFGLVAVLLSFGVRLAYGAIPLAYFVASVIWLGAAIALGVFATSLVSQAAIRRGCSIRWAVVLGLLAIVPVVIALSVGVLLVQRGHPNLAITDPTAPQTLEFTVLVTLADSVPLLAAWAGVVFLPTLLREHELREREVLVARRDTEIVRLRSHLQPHFVLNTMNAISGLVADDPEQARELLSMLGDIFRDAASSEQAHPVSAEVDWLKRFVKIHELRFPGQLAVAWSMDASLADALVPTLILQPLVENALRHGALRRPDGRIAVRVAREGGGLVLEVKDNGPGLGARRVGGKGLDLVERRLALEVRDAPVNESVVPRLALTREGDETVARVALPVRTS